ncbi:MAG TPA: DUF5916 domain-containing protein [Longimicrobiaceae bacterium]|nr:DUF5916 domain-containing protein [Longimicrobiaceae bacterium]
MHFRTLPLIAVTLAAAALPAGRLRAQDSTALRVATHASGATPQMMAVARTGAISIDGRLDEETWRIAQPTTGFRQQDPHEGQPATERTEVRIAFDQEALYIGARMYDSLGAQGVHTRLGRRDQNLEGDYLQLVLDTYHDHTGRTVFTINPSGVKQDAGQASPSADPSWDPIYTVATQIDSLGWTAEFRIPFSQLRYPRDPVQTWGMQVWRYIERKNEVDMWSFWGKNQSGGPSRFGHVLGLHAPPPRRSVELLPYALARRSYVRPADPDNPFEEPVSSTVRVGADVKALLTSTLTLDATINPDFGQVEVDPAVVNLSAFETFFEEKRPFFIEGSGLFDFGDFSCHFCSNVSSMSLFYSRRIGRSPQGFVTGPAVFTHSPENSTILGAAKITGRTRAGLQIGLLDAVTRSERALALSPTGDRFTEQVEPPTNYFVGRLKRNYRSGATTLGMIGTSVNRWFDSDPLQRRIPGSAQALGTDWSMFWKDRTYSLIGNFAVSNVNGDSAAILRLQQSSARYFQRPDRGEGSNGLFTSRFDRSLEHLRGFGGYARLAKDAGPWQWETAVNYRSPGFEVNDLAFLSQADYVWMNFNGLRIWNKPTRHYRDLVAIVGTQQQYNFDRDLTSRNVHGYLGSQLANYWNVSGFVIWNTAANDDRRLRGGPVVRVPASVNYFFNLSTDSRKRIVLGTNPTYGRTTEGAVGWSANLDVRIKPASNVQLSVGPYYSVDHSRAQFVTAFGDPTATAFSGRRVVFSDLEQHTLGMDTRLNWTFSPTLTLELFAQPFVATGAFDNYKEYVRPRSFEKRSFDDTQLTPIVEDGRVTGYHLDPDHNAATGNLEFGNPDFNFRSLRGNAVLRWEYRPGSTLFVVWQQQRSEALPFGDFDLGRDAPAVFQSPPDNVFVVKVSYWFGR